MQFEGATKIDFQMEGVVVTSGQPYEGVSVTNDKINVRAGRHLSHKPTDMFRLNMREHNVLYVGGSIHWGQKFPAKLNFVIYGNITFAPSDGDG